MELCNTYEDPRRAAAYNELELGGTYDLVFRSLPGLLEQHVSGTRALDFGCGTGRSSRFLQALGFMTTGVDISAEMVEYARQRDPESDYRVIEDGNFLTLPAAGFDLVQSAFTFDNISGIERRARFVRESDGALINRHRYPIGQIAGRANRGRRSHGDFPSKPGHSASSQPPATTSPRLRPSKG